MKKITLFRSGVSHLFLLRPDNILDFVVSVTTTQLFYYSAKVTINHI